MHQKEIEPILVFICGASGAISTTLIIGAVTNAQTFGAVGLVTESPQVKKLAIEFPDLASFIFTGWDIKKKNLYDAAVSHNVCAEHILNKALLSAITPRAGIGSQETSVQHWIQKEAAEINRARKEHKARQVFLVNLLPTESYSLQVSDDKIDWEEFQDVNINSPGVTLSRIYFRLAIEANAHFINFTPNVAETIRLKTMALEKGILFSGRDGKTGQTFLKTLIAPGFRDRNLLIEGWYSTNILGNEDGKALHHYDAFLTKQKSKSESLSAILGYVPGGEKAADVHHVHIHYYPPRGDAKESWDNIDFSGFLGSRMQLKLNWLGKDSILAAPLILDMIRILTIAAEAGRRGVAVELGYFFKSPLHHEHNTPIHEVALQFDILLRYIKQCAQTNHPQYRLIAERLEKDQSNKTIPLSPLVYVHTGVAGSVLLYEKRRYASAQRRSDIDQLLQTTYYIELICSQLKVMLHRACINIVPCEQDKSALLTAFSACASGDNIFLIAEEYGGNPKIIQAAKKLRLKIHFIPIESDGCTIHWEKLQLVCEAIKPKCIWIDWPLQSKPQKFSVFAKPNNCLLINNISYHFRQYTSSNIAQERLAGDIVLLDTSITFPGTRAWIALTDNIPGWSSQVYAEKTHTRLCSINPFTLSVALLEYTDNQKAVESQHLLNTRAFAEALGLPVEKDIYSMYYPLLVPFSTHSDAEHVSLKLQTVGISTEVVQCRGKETWSLPFSLWHVTLLGMKEPDAFGLGQLVRSVLHNTITTEEAYEGVEKLFRNIHPSCEIPALILSMLDYSNGY